MTTVTFASYAYGPHLERLHAPGVLAEMIASHRYPFDEVLIVHQNCRGMVYRPITEVNHRVVESEDYYPQIFDRFNIDLNNPVSARDCHGPGWHWWWPNHVQNHLITLEEAKGDYIVFSDCDCLIVNSDDARSWVEEGISILKQYPQVLIVCPDEGGQMAEARLPGGVRLTRNASQQLFIAERVRFKAVDFDVPWNWEKLMPGGPMQEVYHLLEGRIWRYMDKYGYWRALLPPKWRYWHYGDWRPAGWIQWKIERGEQP